MEFKEKQHLNLWWLYILIGLETIVVLSVLFLGKNRMSMQDLKDSYFLPLFGLALPYLIIYFVNKNTLTLSINQDGITYQYWPFAKQKSIGWHSISKAYLRKYDAFGEYGGWGVRYRLWFKLKDKAYILNDENRGLQLELHHNKKILFSTKKPDELSLFLINLKQRNNIGAIETDARER